MPTSLFLSLQAASHTSAPPLPLLEALKRQRDNPSFCPSINDRMATDVTSAVCTVIELCCVKQLRAAIHFGAGLLERISVIRQLLSSGQLQLPRYVCMYVYWYMVN